MTHVDPNIIGLYLALAITLVVAGITWIAEEYILNRFHSTYAPLLLGIGLTVCQGIMIYGHWTQATPEVPLTAIIGGLASNSPGLVSWVCYFIPLYAAFAAFLLAHQSARLEPRDQARFNRELAPSWVRSRWN